MTIIIDGEEYIKVKDIRYYLEAEKDEGYHCEWRNQAGKGQWHLWSDKHFGSAKPEHSIAICHNLGDIPGENRYSVSQIWVTHETLAKCGVLLVVRKGFKLDVNCRVVKETEG